MYSVEITSRGTRPSTPGGESQLSILFPTHSGFETYGIYFIVELSKDGQNKAIYGYPLKEGMTTIKATYDRDSVSDEEAR